MGPDEEVIFVNGGRSQYKGKRTTAPVEVKITGHGEIFKKELVPLKIGEIFKAEPASHERAQQRNKMSDNEETMKKKST